MPTYPQIAADIAMAVLIGMLTGLEREHERKEGEPLFAGIRTFPLISLVGYVAGLVAKLGYGSVLAVAFAGVFLIVAAEYVLKSLAQHPGSTTEFVAILTFLAGVLIAFGYLIPAATITIVATLTLMLKQPLHLLAQRIQAEEIYAILKFAIVTVIILPLLPNRVMGPFQVFNPRFVWWIVVFISAISMVGYVAMRFLGTEQGIALTGFLGGLVSSTVATLGLSKDARASDDSLANFFALGILIASTTMFFRVLFVTLVIEPGLARSLALPIALPTLVGVGISAFLWRRKGVGAAAKVPLENPMELGRALKFGFLFAVIMIASKLAYQYFGAAGIYVASALAGLSELDAITVSVAHLAHDKVLTYSTANASILLASASNTLVKGLIAMVIGRQSLRAVILPIFAALLVSTMAAFIWVILH
jgi:uncharacterized membrane protein (DUF4010 family)